MDLKLEGKRAFISGSTQGIGFATPVDDAMEVMTDIIQYGEVIRGYLGMEAQKITPLLAMLSPSYLGSDPSPLENPPP